MWLSRYNIKYLDPKNQNIESRVFNNLGANTQSIAIAYSSEDNKFIADRPTLNNLLYPKYYISESNAINQQISYEFDKSIYTNLLDILVDEYISTSSIHNSQSFYYNLFVNYIISESNSTNNRISYEIDKPIYTNLLDTLIDENFFDTTYNLFETSSFLFLINVNYNITESNAAETHLSYEFSKSLNSEDNFYLIKEFIETSSLFNSSSINQFLYTNYNITESNSINDQISYEISKSIYSEDNFYILVVENITTSSVYNTSSIDQNLYTNYNITESILSGSYVTFENNNLIFLEDLSYLLLET